ncbi:MAG: cupredoxin domain-containing protein [bacterium]|nr:cupredoxin domain-containing protein [bacterium]
MQRFFMTGGMVAIAAVVIVGALGIGQRIADGKSLQPQTGTPTISAPSGAAAQRVTLTYDGRNYSPATIRVRRGVPVEITADLATVRGCYRAFSIPDLGIATQFSEQRPRLTFTPTRAGTYRFSCAMGMGSGQLIVEG